MKIGLLPDAMKPGIHGVRTRWNRGFMAFRLVSVLGNRRDTCLIR